MSVLSAADYGSISAINAFNATVSAIEYAVPLQSFSKLASVLVGDGVINKLSRGLELSTPNDTLVVSPNVDTLYSTALVDLAETDLVLTVPSISGRFWDYTFYDPYGGVYTNIGSLTGNDAGEYLVRRAVDACTEPGLQLGNHSHPYKGIVNSPVTNAIMLSRILVKNNGSDLIIAQTAVNQTKVRTVPRVGPNRLRVPPLSNSTFTGTANATKDPAELLLLLARLNPGNPPYNISSTAKLESELKAAGVHNGSYAQPAGVNLTHANETAVAAITSGRARVFVDLGHGWVRNVPQGFYGSDYIARDIVAEFGYLENTPQETIYPALLNNTMSLADDESYIYTFHGKPPLLGDGNGFWSLTMYNLQHDLVANPARRYAVGDRSNITHPDGTPVYGSGKSEIDRPFQVLVQSLNTPPPANWTNNWLPAPTNFTILLRFYAPESPITNGSYKYPTITKGQAITR